MDCKLSIYFVGGKDLTIVLKEDDFNAFLEEMVANKVHFNDDKKSGFGIPIYNVMYYTFTEYTDEMKKIDEERVNKLKEDKNKPPKEEPAKVIQETK